MNNSQILLINSMKFLNWDKYVFKIFLRWKLLLLRNFNVLYDFLFAVMAARYPFPFVVVEVVTVLSMAVVVFVGLLITYTAVSVTSRRLILGSVAGGVIVSIVRINTLFMHLSVFTTPRLIQIFSILVTEIFC